MGWDFCNTNIVKNTRLTHRCAYCGRVIPRGSKNILHWNGLFDGEFQNNYACNWCEDHSDKLVEDDGEEISDECIDYYFESKKPEHSYIESEGDYFVFKSIDDEEVARIKCPIQR